MEGVGFVYDGSSGKNTQPTYPNDSKFRTNLAFVLFQIYQKTLIRANIGTLPDALKHLKTEMNTPEVRHSRFHRKFTGAIAAFLFTTLYNCLNTFLAFKTPQNSAKIVSSINATLE